MKHIFFKKSSKNPRYASLRPIFAGVGGTTAACCPDGLPHLAMSPAYVQSVHTKSTKKAIKKEKKYANTARRSKTAIQPLKIFRRINCQKNKKKGKKGWNRGSDGLCVACVLEYIAQKEEKRMLRNVYLNLRCCCK